MRRARGCGGRFLTKNSSNKKGGTGTEKAGERKFSQSSRSLSSEVLQSEGRNLNSSKKAYGGGRESSLLGSEVTSMYSRGDLDPYQIDHLRRSGFHSLSIMMDSGQGFLRV
ncbi:hypothetical protein GIB67_034396 [Kingdonia uniflora]|uniref:Uncharacterized protein n=1 Tax=Kingdonia uniflora TaxID=39325 RepID=A0A7J7NSP5_9MAGN|nr:hypothetical protein GIB67_034396 [Kingdonia uniflora]